MNVVRRGGNVRVSDMRIGDLFWFNETLYMKTDVSRDRNILCVCLNDGYIKYFPEGDGFSLTTRYPMAYGRFVEDGAEYESEEVDEED